MHVVAITRLATAVDGRDLRPAGSAAEGRRGGIELEAAALAADLGTLAYDQRQKLAAGTPAVILTTPDEARATALLAAVRARGHTAVRCRDVDVVASADMLALRHPQLEPGALVAAGGAAPARLRWEDLAVLVRATHRITTETRGEVTETKASLGRAVLTGGLVTTKSTTRAQIARSNELEGVLYIFARTGGVPWLLREQHARFDALGAAVTPTSARNFALLVDVLRTRARAAAFDDRLVARKAPPADVDLLVHLVALSIDASAASPFR